jgi:hypothetical protein
VRPVYPQFILGTDAFISCCIHRGSAPYQWVWDPGVPNLHERGLVISAATIEQVHDYLRKLADSGRQEDLDDAKHLQHGIDKVVTLFRQKGCILPITDALLVYVHTALDFSIEYRRRNGAVRALGLLEKIVIASAIVGYREQPLWLMDYEQPAAFARLRRDYGLHVHEFEHRQQNRIHGIAS